MTREEYINSLCLDNDVDIIDTTKHAHDAAGYAYGCSNIGITKEMLLALLDGKTLHHYDGEYVNNIFLIDIDKEPKQ